MRRLLLFAALGFLLSAAASAGPIFPLPGDPPLFGAASGPSLAHQTPPFIFVGGSYTDQEWLRILMLLSLPPAEETAPDLTPDPGAPFILPPFGMNEPPFLGAPSVSRFMAAAPVPEPSTLSAVSLGLLAACLFCRARTLRR